MKLWIDAQLAPSLAAWMTDRFGVEAHALRDLGLRNAKDRVIFEVAREAGAVLLTKDQDFVEIQAQRGAPPQILWLTCGNTSNDRMRTLLESAFPRIQSLLAEGEPLVELKDP
jgi:predicted nuclease of predicted toxin-antitoxin system